MVYFDNAATGGFKPRAAIDAAETVIKYLSANPGRGGHRLSVTGEKIVYGTREVLAKFFCAKEERVVFTNNCTQALNTAIFGTVKLGGHVITTVYEHNSVLRPLYYLEKKGLITFDVVSPVNGKDVVSAIEEKINDKTYLIITTAVSNVTGEVLPVEKIANLAKTHSIKYLVDGAQGGGHVKLSLSLGINMIALAGHKGLSGIMGSGVLIFDEDTEVSPIIFGGTGSESNNLNMPEVYPDRLEAGTLNLPAIAALKEGATYALNNLENFSENLLINTDRIITYLSSNEKIKVYSTPNSAGIVAFSVDNIPSAEVADILNSEYDIAVRAGLHCAPLLHKFLGTEKEGLIRCSLAVQNSSHEISHFLSAIDNIVRS